MKFFAFMVFVLSASSALAAEISKFPTDAVSFLDVEIPQMDNAVANKDRTYFGPALARVRVFLDGQQPDMLERFPACTAAIGDFLIVGLCKISRPGSICEPETFFPKFSKNMAQCRLSAELEPTLRLSND